MPTKLQKLIIAKQKEKENYYRELFSELANSNNPRWIKDRTCAAIHAERAQVIESYNIALRVIAEVSK